MVLEYENDNGKRKLIGNPKDFNEVVEMSREFLKNRDILYWEWMEGDNVWILDFGSWREFIFLSNIKPGLYEEMEKFYSKGEKNGTV